MQTLSFSSCRFKVAFVWFLFPIPSHLEIYSCWGKRNLLHRVFSRKFEFLVCYFLSRITIFSKSLEKLLHLCRFSAAPTSGFHWMNRSFTCKMHSAAMKTKATRRSALIAGITRYFEKAINFIEAHCTIQTLNNFTERFIKWKYHELSHFCANFLHKNFVIIYRLPVYL